VFGNPTLAALPALDGAEAEARAIKELLGNRATVYVGAAATEANLRDNAYGRRLVRLATHAQVREGADESRIYLAPGLSGSSSDGILRASEIEALMLDDALVVLSACETGLGRAQADGIQGVGQALLRAGARAVVLSLWRVDDTATAALMTAFYRGLIGGAGVPPLDAAGALARAQAETRASWPAISQWGPWLLLGDGGWTLD
jgi:CHAT domain-containing protein